MEDKYEEFKKWLAEKRICVTKIETETSHFSPLVKPFISPLVKSYFDDFEKMMEKKERKKALEKELYDISKNYLTKDEIISRIVNFLDKEGYLE